MADTNERLTGHIAPLGTLGKYEIAKNFRDPRGWDVILGDGTKVGKVKDLIVDTEALKTRYLEVNLFGKPIGFDHDRNVLVPVGAARLDTDRDHVVLDSIELRQLAALPPYDRHLLTREYETAVLSGFGSTDNTTEFSREDPFYKSRNFDDTLYRDGNAIRRVERDEREVVEAKHSDSEIRVPLTDEKIVIEKNVDGRDELVIRRPPGEKRDLP